MPTLFWNRGYNDLQEIFTVGFKNYAVIVIKTVMLHNKF